jgi:hypothetical protein
MSVALFCVGNFLEAGPFYVLGPAIAKLHLGGAGTWGLILSAGGIGSVAGGLAALRFRPSRPLLWMNIGWGISLSQLYLLALVAPAWVLIAAAAVAGAAISVDLTLWFTVIQSTIPTGSLSRVSSYDELGSFIFEPLSFACVGIVAGHVGTARTLWLAAGGCSAVFLAGIATPSIRNLRLERLGPATEP